VKKIVREVSEKPVQIIPEVPERVSSVSTVDPDIDDYNEYLAFKEYKRAKHVAVSKPKSKVVTPVYSSSEDDEHTSAAFPEPMAVKKKFTRPLPNQPFRVSFWGR